MTLPKIVLQVRGMASPEPGPGLSRALPHPGVGKWACRGPEGRGWWRAAHLPPESPCHLHAGDGHQGPKPSLGMGHQPRPVSTTGLESSPPVTSFHRQPRPWAPNRSTAPLPAARNPGCTPTELRPGPAGMLCEAQASTLLTHRKDRSQGRFASSSRGSAAQHTHRTALLNRSFISAPRLLLM